MNDSYSTASPNGSFSVNLVTSSSRHHFGFRIKFNTIRERNESLIVLKNLYPNFDMMKKTEIISHDGTFRYKQIIKEINGLTIEEMKDYILQGKTNLSIKEIDGALIEPYLSEFNHTDVPRTYYDGKFREVTLFKLDNLRCYVGNKFDVNEFLELNSDIIIPFIKAKNTELLRSIIVNSYPLTENMYGCVVSIKIINKI